MRLRGDIDVLYCEWVVQSLNKISLKTHSFINKTLLCLFGVNSGSAVTLKLFLLTNKTKSGNIVIVRQCKSLNINLLFTEHELLLNQSNLQTPLIIFKIHFKTYVSSQSQSSTI